MAKNFLDLLDEQSENRIFTESVKILNEKNIIRFDKKTMKKRLLRQATLLAAKDANDPLFKKYVKFSKGKKNVREQIQQKYQSKGKSKLKEYVKAHKELSKTDEK